MRKIKKTVPYFLKQIILIIGILGAVSYLLSGITVSPPEKDEISNCDDWYWRMIESEETSTHNIEDR